MASDYNYQYKDTLIKIDNISLSFGDKVVLKPISIEVKDIVRPDVCQGQIIGLLGASGCGKTQFSKILAGLNKPTTGSVSVGGKPVEAGMVGYVAQNYPLFDHRTVLGNLLVALEHLKISKKEKLEKINQYLSSFNLLDKSNLYPSSLSNGMRQRVAIIQELLCSEHYLILDEPTSGLDILMKNKVENLIMKISSLHEENTILVVSHDIPSIISIVDTIWLLGRDRDSDNKFIDGVYIKKEYNLIERGLCWNPNIREMTGFFDLIKEINNEFKNL